MFNIPRPREFLSVHGFQMVVALSRVMNDSVWPIPCGAELPLGGLVAGVTLHRDLLCPVI